MQKDTSPPSVQGVHETSSIAGILACNALNLRPEGTRPALKPTCKSLMTERQRLKWGEANQQIVDPTKRQLDNYHQRQDSAASLDTSGWKTHHRVELIRHICHHPVSIVLGLGIHCHSREFHLKAGIGRYAARV